MYIIKNALRQIGRAKGRNILIGLIALVIAVSACIGLSIRQASESARQDTLSGMTVTDTSEGELTLGGTGGMGDMGGATQYITEIDSAMNLTVVFQMLGLGLLLTLAASAVSVLFVMRYDPQKILANRD